MTVEEWEREKNTLHLIKNGDETYFSIVKKRAKETDFSKKKAIKLYFFIAVILLIPVVLFGVVMKDMRAALLFFGVIYGFSIAVLGIDDYICTLNKIEHNDKENVPAFFLIVFPLLIWYFAKAFLGNAIGILLALITLYFEYKRKKQNSFERTNPRPVNDDESD